MWEGFHVHKPHQQSSSMNGEAIYRNPHQLSGWNGLSNRCQLISHISNLSEISSCTIIAHLNVFQFLLQNHFPVLIGTLVEIGQCCPHLMGIALSSHMRNAMVFDSV